MDGKKDKTSQLFFIVVSLAFCFFQCYDITGCVSRRLPVPKKTHTHTTILLLFWNMSGTTRVSRYQKGKTILDLLEQETVGGSGICWAICKSAPHPRQPHQHPITQFFYRPDALADAQPTASKHWRQVPKKTELHIPEVSYSWTWVEKRRPCSPNLLLIQRKM